MPKGKLITLEGIDGSGKTTQQKLLGSYLSDEGFTTHLLREPGDTRLGEAVRDILLGHSTQRTDINPIAEYLLFAVARSQFVTENLEPALEKLDFVISDRFIDSSVAYQGYGHGVNLSLIENVNSFITNGIKPDLTIVFDISIEKAFSRLPTSQDRMEKYGKDFFKRVRAGYLTIAEDEPERVVVIDADRDMEIISLEVNEVVMELIKTAR